MVPTQANAPSDRIFSGHVFIFHAFDIGEDINLQKVGMQPDVKVIPLKLPKYFKNYHIPLAIEPLYERCISCKIHNFGAVSLTYKVPFNTTFEQLRQESNYIVTQYQEQSLADVEKIFTQIQAHITKPKFFHTRSEYLVIQMDPSVNIADLSQLEKEYGALIASMLRLEIETLSEYQKNEIFASAIGYFRGDLIIVDTDAAFVYDDEYEEKLDFFEFANIQQLELRYFDRVLDQQLKTIYEGEVYKLSWRAYLPFLNNMSINPVGALSKLRVEISMITERLESSIKLAGEPYFSELYALITDKLDLKAWRESIDRKLMIVEAIQVFYQEKIDVTREDMLSVLIIVLIFIELIIGILHYLK